MEAQLQIQPEPQALSPFISIWVKPRETIRKIVDTDPTKYVIVLAVLSGIIRSLDRVSSQNMGDSLSLPVLLGICVVIGPVGGIILMYMLGALYRWSGSWLGGQATSEEVRADIAWSSVPSIFFLPLWIPQLIIFGKELFSSSTPRMDANPFLYILLMGFAVIELIASIWTLVLLIKCLGEVHQFSAWRALGAIILGSLVFIGPILCIVVTLALVTPQ